MNIIKPILRKVVQPLVVPVTGLPISGEDSEESWSSYWKPLFDFFWYEGAGNITDTQLIDKSGNGNNITITGKDFVTSYIPATSAATFQIPDSATLIADDTDFFWVTALGARRQVTVGELNGYDLPRTFIWYDNAAPHHIRAIGILKSLVVVTDAIKNKASKDFKLWMFHFTVQNDYGYPKENRPSTIWATPTAYLLTNAHVKGWWKFDELPTITKDGSNLVSQWNDMRGSGRDLLATGTQRPTWTANGVLFNGFTNVIKAIFDWNQPEWILICLKQLTWTNGAYIMDGNSNASARIWDVTPSPNIQQYAGVEGSPNGNLTVNTLMILRALFSGLNSYTQVNETAKVISNAGVNNADALTIGARGGLNSGYSNILVTDIIALDENPADADNTGLYNYTKRLRAL